MTLMTNVIKVRFLNYEGAPYGKDYTYRTPAPVAAGDIVDVATSHGPAQVQVTEINVPEDEILKFGTRGRFILGKHKSETATAEAPQSTESADGQIGLIVPAPAVTPWDWRH